MPDINGEWLGGLKKSLQGNGDRNTDERQEEGTGMSAKPMSLTDWMPFIGVEPLPIGVMWIWGISACTVISYRHKPPTLKTAHSLVAF